MRRPRKPDPLDLPYGADPLDGAVHRPTYLKKRRRQKKKPAKPGALAKAQAYARKPTP